MSAHLHWLEVIGRCRFWLAQSLEDSPRQQVSDTECHRHVLIMNCSLQYACDTLDAVTTELLARRPLQAAVLVRTLFELAVRLRWASVNDDGWRRLAAYWVRQHEKSLKEVDQTHLCGEAADRRNGLLEDYGAFLEEVTSPQPAQFDQVLDQTSQEIDGRNNRNWSGTLYNGYRDLCRYAHANMTVCAGGVPFSDVGKVLLCNVCFATVQFVEAARRALGDTFSEGDLDEIYALPGLVDECLWNPEGLDV